jgi:hypothetical protein
MIAPIIGYIPTDATVDQLDAWAAEARRVAAEPHRTRGARNYYLDKAVDLDAAAAHKRANEQQTVEAH